MKLMRSRFRLISLLLTCVFLLTAVVCAASALRQAGIALPSVSQVIPIPGSPSSDASPASSSPEVSPAEEEATPVPSETPGENIPGETTIQPDSEYNIFGL